MCSHQFFRSFVLENEKQTSCATFPKGKVAHDEKTKMKQQAKQIIQILDTLFPEPPIPLHHKDPFTLLIAVLLSASCTDERVNKTTPHLFHLADTPEKMAELSYREVEAIIRPCGLFRNKAKAIVELSKILVAKYKGHVPKSFEALEELPGVGHKTASVVMVQAFGISAFPVDTHIYRCARRWGISSAKSIAAVEMDLKAFFPKKSWNKVHLQIIYYARRYCPARGHHIAKCPICSMLMMLMR